MRYWFDKNKYKFQGSEQSVETLVCETTLILLLLFQAEQDLRLAQTEFDRQAEVTQLLLEGISSTHVRQSEPQIHKIKHIFSEKKHLV